MAKATKKSREGSRPTRRGWPATTRREGRYSSRSIRSSLRPIAHGVVDAPSRNDVSYKVTVVMSLP